MRKTALARRYARALISVGREEDAYERFGNDLSGLVGVFKSNPELYKVLLNPMYKLEARKGLTDNITTKLGAAEEVKRFLAILVESRNVTLLEEISEAYSGMEDELSGRLRVTVEAPEEVDKGLAGAIKKRLEDETKKEVILSFVKNPELIGGVVLKIGNTVVDGSLRAQLERVSEKILQGVL
jgi:F-type H+-transporting ATPase subunit delta